jgi:hypothetical protein
VRFLVKEWNQGRNPQGPLLLDGNRDAPRGLELRCRDQGPRDNRYTELIHNRHYEHRNDRVRDQDM